MTPGCRNLSIVCSGFPHARPPKPGGTARRPPGCPGMKRKWPTELGDALLVAAAVTTLTLFGWLYATLPPTAVEVQTVGQTQAPSPRGGR